jgi:hypothetical protein
MSIVFSVAYPYGVMDACIHPTLEEMLQGFQTLLPPMWNGPFISQKKIRPHNKRKDKDKACGGSRDGVSEEKIRLRSPANKTREQDSKASKYPKNFTK